VTKKLRELKRLHKVCSRVISLKYFTCNGNLNLTTKFMDSHW